MKKVSALAASVLGLVLSFGLVTVTQADTRVYSVMHVAPDDALNLRSSAGTSGNVMAVIPPNGQGIVAAGEERKVGRSTWAKVYWAGIEGWVNKYYLREDVQTSSYNPGSTKPVRPDVILQCSGTEPFWKMNISETSMDIDMVADLKYAVPVSFRQQSSNNTSIAVVAGKKGDARTSAFLQKVETCSDGMSDRSYPYAITAVLGDRKVVSGCCGIVDPR